ncbi:MAG: CdaR family protein [Turicibacter sp.]|nr:CdaR family protein [Turicibacter sp.]
MEKQKGMIFNLAAILLKDLHWKFLAMVLAFLLWFVGTNINNPISAQAYNNLPLTILNRDIFANNGIVLINEQQILNANISVNITASRNDHELINAARNDNIQLSIDFGDIDINQIRTSEDVLTLSLPINLQIHQSYGTRTITPNALDLVLDLYAERMFTIGVDITGMPEEGYEQREYVHSPRVVRLGGARSLLNDISSVGISIDINNATETMEETRPISVRNQLGNDITNQLALSVSYSTISVPVSPHGDIFLHVNQIGTPSYDFVVTEIVINPPGISLVGDAEILETTDFIMLGNIDLTSITTSIEQTFNIREVLEGTGLNLGHNSPEEAVVTVFVEELIPRNFDFPINNLTVIGATLPYTFDAGNTVPITLRGRTSVINNITMAQINAGIDLTGLAEGTHYLQVSVIPPTGITLTNQPTIQVIIAPEEPEEPEDEPTEDEDEELDEDEEDVSEDEGEE